MGVVFSVPINLKSSVKEFEKWSMTFYRNRFLKKLESKVKAKSELYPHEITYHNFDKIKYFPDFDRLYTAPLHGFTDEEDFYQKASSELYLRGITKPTLLINAINDPFLPKECYPTEIARKHDTLYFESPRNGGHVGFTLNRKSNYMEKRAYEFSSQFIL